MEYTHVHNFKQILKSVVPEDSLNKIKKLNVKSKTHAAGRICSPKYNGS